DGRVAPTHGHPPIGDHSIGSPERVNLRAATTYGVGVEVSAAASGSAASIVSPFATAVSPSALSAQEALARLRSAHEAAAVALSAQEAVAQLASLQEASAQLAADHEASAQDASSHEELA